MNVLLAVVATAIGTIFAMTIVSDGTINWSKSMEIVKDYGLIQGFFLIMIGLAANRAASSSAKSSERSAKVSERTERRFLIDKRKTNFESFLNVILGYREILANHPIPLTAVVGEDQYEIKIIFDIELCNSSRYPVMMHAIKFTNRSSGEIVLFATFRGDDNIEPYSLYCPNLEIFSERDWDTIFMAIMQTINIQPFGAGLAEDIINDPNYDGRDGTYIVNSFSKKIRGRISMKGEYDKLIKHAIKSNNYNQFRRYIRQVTNVNARDIRGETFLHYAAESYCSDPSHYSHNIKNHLYYIDPDERKEVAELNNSSILKSLIEEDANIDARSDDGGHVLFKATTASNWIAIKMLIESGVAIDATCGPEQMTALHRAALYGQKFEVDMLVKGGADVNFQSSNGRTPLHYVLLSDNAMINRDDCNCIINTLMQNSANLEIEDEFGITPGALYAEIREMTEILESNPESLDINAYQITKNHIITHPKIAIKDPDGTVFHDVGVVHDINSSDE